MQRRLPEAYRRFLRDVANGGNVADAIAIFEAEGEGEADLHQLYGIHHPESYADLEAYLTTPGDQLTDPRVLPIGYDSGGNAIVIHLSIPPVGQVSLCDHEADLPLEQNLHRIADTFDDFVSGLRLEPLQVATRQSWLQRLKKRLGGV